MLLGISLFLAFAFVSKATPTLKQYIVHETRPQNPEWNNIGTPSSNTVIPIRIGLAQSNLEKGAQWLREVSDPASKKYGKHWKPEQIIKAFQPKPESYLAVQSWLESSGISAERISIDVNHWVTFDASVGEAERLLKTQYFSYEHAPTGLTRIGCESYSLPSSISPHVELITPSVHFVLPGRQGKLINRVASPPVRIAQPVSSGAAPSFTGYGAAAVQSLVQQSTASCFNTTVPDCLRYLYSIPISYISNANNSFGITEFAPHNYMTSDLNGFYQYLSQRQVGTVPVDNSVNGGQINVAGTQQGDELEAVLDFQIANLVWPQQTTLFQGISKTTFNDILDSIDGSYCTYQGGDQPGYDYMTPSSQCGIYSPPLVLSTSYDYNENVVPYSYAVRQCNEYMKLGLQGVSVVFSSGDYGVAGYGGSCMGNNNVFTPMFPPTCPYVTAVGATQVQGTTNIGTTTGQPEQAVMSTYFGFYSGGGFSNYFGIPWYQSPSVPNYVQNYAPMYPQGTWNNNSNARAYPDVSAAGWDYVIYLTGGFGFAYGTSASAPAFASILTLINQQRLNAGKSPVGFVNPALYANPSLSNDITAGSNPGCQTNGFPTSPGWDPVSGMGTPKFPAMLAYFMGLP